MAIFEIKVPKNVSKALGIQPVTPYVEQTRVLKKLLRRARFTQFGQQFHFDEILLSGDPVKKFQSIVPIFNYNKIHNEWWHKTLSGVPDVCWPGKIKYYALSSGTSESSSKFIPVTTDLLKGNRIVMLKQLMSLRYYDGIPYSSLSKGWLALGGSTELQRGESGYFAGDLSGITAKKVPIWFQPFYKPGKQISKQKDWNRKLEEIVKKAPQWDIGFLVGVPAWVQMCLEMIIDEYKLKNIHEIWPNLSFFVHGGVSFEPYKKGFEKLLGKQIIYIETYLASEGFIACQDRQHVRGMKLVTSEHIFFEFIPFDDVNFCSDGELISNPTTMMLNQVEEGKEYALLMSTTAGAWRYLIGDTIKFVDVKNCEIMITGRTKHFLNLVGEHLSVENMNRSLQLACVKFDLSIPEFTVAGIPYEGFFAHHWYIACDDVVDKQQLITFIDNQLCQLNDDYAVERKSALKAVFLDILPESTFNGFMQWKGKMGGQHKFPRVLKGKMLEDWGLYLKQNNLLTGDDRVVAMPGIEPGSRV